MPKPFSKLGLHAPYIVNVIMPGNASVVSVAIPIDDYLVLDEAREAHTVLGTDGGGLTMTIEKLTGTQAPGGGSNMFKTSTFNLAAAVNTGQRLAASALLATMSAAQKAARLVSPGDRVSLTITGVTTAVAGVGVTLVFRRTRPGAAASTTR